VAGVDCPPQCHDDRARAVGDGCSNFGISSGNFESRNALSARANAEERSMLSTILIIVLILLLVGALPTWPYSANWGYGPGGGVGLLLIILVVLVLMGRI
jgi:hypothetical protein